MGKESVKTEQVKESKYKILNKIPLGDLNHTHRVVVNSYYIVYEKTLLEPKILNYPFKERYFANRYVLRYLSSVNTFICQGKELLELGFDKPLGKATTRKHQTDYLRWCGLYGLNTDLTKQQRKSLRTNYRRQFRRRLIKLLNNGKTNNNC